MGLFGYGAQKKIVTPLDTISPELEEAIKASTADNRMACKSCWAIAEDTGCSKLDVSGACEALEIKISPCQLGAF